MSEYEGCFVQLFVCIDGRRIDSDLRKDALSLQKSLKWDDQAPALAESLAPEVKFADTILLEWKLCVEKDSDNFLLPLQTGGSAVSSQDDEYRWAGVEDPKVVLTTSRDPSSRLKMFAKVSQIFFWNDECNLFTIFFF